MKDYNKRFSVDLDGRIVAAFDTVQECELWIDSHWWVAWATIYDHENREPVATWGKI